jgi:manganese efflux pump family protein
VEIAATILLLSLALAMDATAVAAARSLVARRVPLRRALAMPLLFGTFQAGMPALGWLAGDAIGSAVAAWDHWIASALLAGIGGKMIVDAIRECPEERGRDERSFEWGVLVVLAIGTSVDAFAAGISLPLLGAPVLVSCLTIGAVTTIASGLGLLLGRRLGEHAGERLEIAGGVVLVLLGTKILVEHLVSS